MKTALFRSVYCDDLNVRGELGLAHVSIDIWDFNLVGLCDVKVVC